MVPHGSRVAPLLFSVAILLIGHGLHLSLLPLRAETMGWSSEQIGLSGSFYFGGLLLGCFSVPLLVATMGHIRVFTVLTAITTAALLSISLLDGIAGWLALRLLIGWSIAGLYLIVESWLNNEVENEDRGSLISIYTVTVLVSMAIGQLLLNVAVPGSDRLIVVAALCIALAAVPVGLTRTPQPDPIPVATFSPLLVFNTSRSATISSFVGGVVTGCFYSLGPIYGKDMNLSVTAISIMMATGILGGALFQWPLGRLSDRIDRRRVILAAMTAGIAVSIWILVAPPRYLPHLVFIFGGCVLPLYSLSLAHAADNVENAFLEVGTGILIVNAIGATTGPIIVALAMGAWGAGAFFVFCSITLALGALSTLVFISRRPAMRPNYVPFEPATTAAAQGAIEMDPRSDEDRKLDASSHL